MQSLLTINSSKFQMLGIFRTVGTITLCNKIQIKANHLMKSTTILSLIRTHFSITKHRGGSSNKSIKPRRTVKGSKYRLHLTKITCFLRKLLLLIIGHPFKLIRFSLLVIL